MTCDVHAYDQLLSTNGAYIFRPAVFENREKMVLVMEYAAGGELYDYLSERKVLSENEARRVFRQVATACFYCHKVTAPYTSTAIR